MGLNHTLITIIKNEGPYATCSVRVTVPEPQKGPAHLDPAHGASMLQTGLGPSDSSHGAGVPGLGLNPPAGCLHCGGCYRTRQSGQHEHCGEA